MPEVKIPYCLGQRVHSEQNALTAVFLNPGRTVHKAESVVVLLAFHQRHGARFDHVDPRAFFLDQRIVTFSKTGPLHVGIFKPFGTGPIVGGEKAHPHAIDVEQAAAVGRNPLEANPDFLAFVMARNWSARKRISS